jgi:cell fate (sporulation/competence/biofilm development) regulator YlbF (YheA/YmcA/DUF963 family)
MENNIIESRIKDFCTLMRDLVPEFKELWEAKKDLDLNIEAKKIWESREEQKQTIDLLKSKGLPVSAQQESELAQKLKEMNENPITMRYLRARNFAKKVAGDIGTLMESEVYIDFTPRKGCK